MRVMANLIDSSDQRHADRTIVGGKAHSLWKLKKGGFHVPEWFVIPVAVASADISDGIRQEIKEGLENFNTSSYAVRSSAVSEDGGQASFAGQFETVLSVRGEEQLLQAIQKVARSVDDARRYAQERGIGDSLEVAVIVQRMIEPDAAGVVFSRESSDQMAPVLINAARGVGTAVVQGTGPIDVYSIDLTSKYVAVDKAGDQAVLTREQVLQLAQLARKVEVNFGEPQDIEWAFKDDTFYLLQSRPITSYPRTTERIWDSSNIAESYTGITLPLTASFAREMYEIVYSRVLRTSGISERDVFSQRRTLKNLLGFPAGRFYYNLKNWYVMLSFFPLFRHNKKFLEQMIGVPEDESYLPPPPSRVFTIWYLTRTFFRVTFFSRELSQFYAAFDRYYAKYRKQKSKQLNIEELEELYDHLERELLYRWHTPIDNDFLVMIFHGWLRRLADKYGIVTTYPSLVNDLLTGLGGVMSAEQASQLLSLARLVQKDDTLREVFRNQRWSELENMENSFPEFFKAINVYKLKFGDRFANELKLETADLSESPVALYELILLYTKMSDQQLEQREKHRDDVRRKAEAHVAKSLSGVRKRVFKWVLKRARYHIKHRESMRLLRAQTFGAARFIFLGFARHFVKQGLLQNKQDIFYLEAEEIFRTVDGSATTGNLQGLTDLRRAEYDAQKDNQLPQRFTTRGIPYENLPLEPESVPASSSGLQGTGCSSGVAHGTAYVMADFEPNADMPEDVILITRHTDPGWIPIFSYVRGLIVEHGGLLSHAAIVSRELGIPCIVGVEDATKIFKTGDKIRLSGDTGRIAVTRQQ